MAFAVVSTTLESVLALTILVTPSKLDVGEIEPVVNKMQSFVVSPAAFNHCTAAVTAD